MTEHKSEERICMSKISKSILDFIVKGNQKNSFKVEVMNPDDPKLKTTNNFYIVPN